MRNWYNVTDRWCLPGRLSIKSLSFRNYRIMSTIKKNHHRAVFECLSTYIFALLSIQNMEKRNVKIEKYIPGFMKILNLWLLYSLKKATLPSELRESRYPFANPFHVSSQRHDFPNVSLSIANNRARVPYIRPNQIGWLLRARDSMMIHVRNDARRKQTAAACDDDDDGNSSSRKVCHSLRNEMKLREQGQMIVFSWWWLEIPLRELRS